MSKYIHDIEITRGETYTNDIEITTDSGDFSLSGKTAKAQIRPKEESETLLAEFSCTVDAANNTVSISLTSEQTSVLTPGVYAYDLFISGTGFRKCYLGGKFIVGGRVTLPE